MAELTCPRCGRLVQQTEPSGGPQTVCPHCGQAIAPPVPGPGAEEELPNRAGLGIVALVLGGLAVVSPCAGTFAFFLAFPLAVAGLVLGIVAIRRTGPTKAHGRGLAVAGTAVSGAAVLITIVLTLLGALIWFRNDIGNWSRQLWTDIRSGAHAPVLPGVASPRPLTREEVLDSLGDLDDDESERLADAYQVAVDYEQYGRFEEARKAFTAVADAIADPANPVALSARIHADCCAAAAEGDGP